MKTDRAIDTVGALKERIKELDCLYQISDIAHQPDLELREILSRVIGIIPAAMQFPELSSVRLSIDEINLSTRANAGGEISIQADVVLNYLNRGRIEAFYSKPQQGKVPAFLPEEERLLSSIAKQVSLVLERAGIEETNSRLQEQLRHADRLATIGQLAAGIAHEINEPLATILGYAQLIAEEEELPDQVAKDVKKITSATLHAREVIKKLMLFSRQVPPNKVALDLNKILSEGFYFLESRCERQGIRVVRQLEPDLPPITADPSQIHQIMVNLAVNAMQAMPEGGVITLSTRKVNDHIEMGISDTGIGMNKEVLSKIFIPFFTTKDIDQGTGLGLSVVHGIVTSHNGRIEVQSEPGKGTSFLIFFEVDND
ncbi:MAG TPA: ATP-binding protein [Candidatus Cloacimonadota bacterium]|nr:ATP-binding protein [Candidatus Cloacimonadota bacterium]